MKQKIYDGWVLVGKRGKIIAFLSDENELVNRHFTNEEAKTTRERVFRGQLIYPPNKT